MTLLVASARARSRSTQAGRLTRVVTTGAPSGASLPATSTRSSLTSPYGATGRPTGAVEDLAPVHTSTPLLLPPRDPRKVPRSLAYLQIPRDGSQGRRPPVTPVLVPGRHMCLPDPAIILVG